MCLCLGERRKRTSIMSKQRQLNRLLTFIKQSYFALCSWVSGYAQPTNQKYKQKQKQTNKWELLHFSFGFRFFSSLWKSGRRETKVKPICYQTHTYRRRRSITSTPNTTNLEQYRRFFGWVFVFLFWCRLTFNLHEKVKMVIAWPAMGHLTSHILVNIW